MDILAMVRFRPLRARTDGRILLVRVDRIGDFVCWLGAARAVREAYPAPENEITLVANNSWAELARALPYFDHVFAIDTERFRRDLSYRWRTARQLRESRYGVVIHPTHSRELLVGDSIVHLSRATRRVAPAGDTVNSSAWSQALSRRWYTQLIPTTEVHELVRNAAFAAGIGAPIASSKAGLLPVLRHVNPTLPLGRFIVLFPGAAAHIRQWPATRFAATAAELARAYEGTFVICGGPADLNACREVVSALACLALPVLDLTARTSLSELVEIIRRADLLITNDTGAAHIAAAVGTPSACIVGGGHFGRCLPYPRGGAELTKPSTCSVPMPCFGCNWWCHLVEGGTDPAPCIEAVTVEAVARTAREALGMISA